jgi:hypothetical protein
VPNSPFCGFSCSLPLSPFYSPTLFYRASYSIFLIFFFFVCVCARERTVQHGCFFFFFLNHLIKLLYNTSRVFLFIFSSLFFFAVDCWSLVFIVLNVSSCSSPSLLIYSYCLARFACLLPLFFFGKRGPYMCVCACVCLGEVQQKKNPRTYLCSSPSHLNVHIHIRPPSVSLTLSLSLSFSQYIYIK